MGLSGFRAISGLGWIGIGLGSLCGVIIWAPLCGANNLCHDQLMPWVSGRRQEMVKATSATWSTSNAPPPTGSCVQVPRGAIFWEDMDFGHLQVTMTALTVGICKILGLFFNEYDSLIIKTDFVLLRRVWKCIFHALFQKVFFSFLFGKLWWCYTYLVMLHAFFWVIFCGKICFRSYLIIIWGQMYPLIFFSWP